MSTFKMGATFERIVGRKLSEFSTPRQLEEAMEKKIGHPLQVVEVDHEQIYRDAQRIIKVTRQNLEKNF